MTKFAVAFMLLMYLLLQSLRSYGQIPAGQVGDAIVEVQPGEKVRLHYQVSGNGKQPLLLLHGSPGSLDDFTMSIQGCLSEQFRLIAFDLPGYGASDRPYKLRPTPTIQARLIRQACKQERILESQKPIIVAHSWGSVIALAYSLAYPNEIAGLILLAPVVYPDESLVPPFAGLVRNIDRSPDGSYEATIVGSQRISKDGFKGSFAVKGGRLKLDADFPEPLKTMLYGLYEDGLQSAFSPSQPAPLYKQKAIHSWMRVPTFMAVLDDSKMIQDGTVEQLIRRHAALLDFPIGVIFGTKDEMVLPIRHSQEFQKYFAAEGRLLPVETIPSGHMFLHTHPAETCTAIQKIAQVLLRPQKAKNRLLTPNPSDQKANRDITAYFWKVPEDLSSSQILALIRAYRHRGELLAWIQQTSTEGQELPDELAALDATQALRWIEIGAKGKDLDSEPALFNEATAVFMQRAKLLTSRHNYVQAIEDLTTAVQMLGTLAGDNLVDRRLHAGEVIIGVREILRENIEYGRKNLGTSPKDVELARGLAVLLVQRSVIARMDGKVDQELSYKQQAYQILEVFGNNENSFVDQQFSRWVDYPNAIARKSTP